MTAMDKTRSLADVNLEPLNKNTWNIGNNFAKAQGGCTTLLYMSWQHENDQRESKKALNKTKVGETQDSTPKGNKQIIVKVTTMKS